MRGIESRDERKRAARKRPARLVLIADEVRDLFDVKPRLHQGNMLPVAVNMLLVIGNKIVASLLPVCCWIQRDTSRP